MPDPSPHLGLDGFAIGVLRVDLPASLVAGPGHGPEDVVTSQVVDGTLAEATSRRLRPFLDGLDQSLIVIEEEGALWGLVPDSADIGGNDRTLVQLGSFHDARRPDLPIGQDDGVGGHDLATELLVAHILLVEGDTCGGMA